MYDNKVLYLFIEPSHTTVCVESAHRALCARGSRIARGWRVRGGRHKHSPTISYVSRTRCLFAFEQPRVKN